MIVVEFLVAGWDGLKLDDTEFRINVLSLPSFNGSPKKLIMVMHFCVGTS